MLITILQTPLDILQDKTKDAESPYSRLVNYLIEDTASKFENIALGFREQNNIQDTNIEYEDKASDTKWIKYIYGNMLFYTSKDFEEDTSHFKSFSPDLVNVLRLEVPNNKNIASKFHSRQGQLVNKPIGSKMFDLALEFDGTNASACFGGQNKTYFINEKMNKYAELNRLLEDIFNYHEEARSCLLVEKTDIHEPLVQYDFKRLTAIFFHKVQNKYLEEQTDIYLKNYPEANLIEALTLSLSRGETSFYGDKVLKPVDDLYKLLLNNLSDFILKPKSINFYGICNNTNCIDKVLERLKERASIKLYELCAAKFTTPELKNMWKDLYMQSGIGADYRRRVGIINTLNYILPSIDYYLNENSEENWIDEIENIINSSISELEQLIKLESYRAAHK